MKKTLLIAGTIFLFHTSYGQQGFVVTGINLQSPDGSNSISIGQVNYSNYENSNGFINEGIQQPIEFYEFTSLQEYYHSPVISLYPNPAANEFCIQLKNDDNHSFSLEIYDAMGNVVLSQITHSFEKVDIRSLAAGMYSVTIKTETNNNSIIKLIKI